MRLSLLWPWFAGMIRPAAWFDKVDDLAFWMSSDLPVKHFDESYDRRHVHGAEVVAEGLILKSLTPSISAQEKKITGHPNNARLAVVAAMQPEPECGPGPTSTETTCA